MTITVRELREILAGCNEEMPVLFAIRSGDYPGDPWGTVTTHSVGHTVSEEKDAETGELVTVISEGEGA